MTDGCDRPGEIPALLHAMWSKKPKLRQQAYDALMSHLVHQGSRYDASAAAVPFLIDVVADPEAPDRYAACQVLRAVAIGDQEYWLTERPDVAAVRHEVARKAALSREELERERAAWVAAAPDEQVRRDRELTSIYNDVETDREAERWNMEAYDAVRAGVPAYVSALESDHPGTRLYASHLLAWFPEERDAVVPALIRVICDDDQAVVAATACVAAGLCGAPGDTALIEALSTRRSASENRAERWAAVIGLAEVTRQPDGGVPSGASFVDLTEPQRAAVRALENSAEWDGDAMFSMLLGKYNLPGEHAAMRRWIRS